MSRKKGKKTDPTNDVEFDQAAADQMAADLEATGDRPSELEELRARLEEAQDRVLRSQAELDNYRKRVARQMDDERRYADLSLMRDMLPVLDNMQRAIEAAEQAHDTADLLEGVKMVVQQFQAVLQRYHCVEIGALGEPFNPHLHEAICQQPSDEHPDGTVLMVTQTGYQLHDRVVRPSQVIVSAASETTDDVVGQEESNDQNAE